MNRQGPPDFPQNVNLSQLLAQLPFSPKLLVFVPVILVLLIGGYTSFYTLKAEEVGVVMRFGEHTRTAESGLRFKLPFGIESVLKVPIERQMKQEFGFGTAGATNPNQFSDDRTEQVNETEMVTGDLNAALIEWVVQYRIENPTQYLFNVRNPDTTLRNASESIMRESVGDRTVDEVLTVGRQEIEDESLANLQKLVNKYEMGLRINQVQLINVNPPRPVQSSFNEVNAAQQEREQAINQANGQYNREVPQARGEAERRISDAEGYAIQRINEAQGDAARFNSLFTEYSKAPKITRNRLYLETMTQIVPRMGRKIILDEDAKQLLPLLNLNESPIKP